MTGIAVCFTPDSLYFKPAVFTAASILAQSDADDIEVVFVCEERDVPAGFADLDPALRSRITLLFVDWERHVAGLPVRGHFTSAVNRRLALDRVLPGRFDRYVSLDADMCVGRPGLSRLKGLDLRGMPFAAAIDMIYLKDVEDGPLTPEFRAYRSRLGLSQDTLYFNNGLTLVDRHAWEKFGVAQAARAFLAANPERCLYLEQSALNAVVQGAFAPLSPRFNFMGDFLLLDLDNVVEPVVYHFVNRPKPWEPGWRGERRFAQSYRDWFRASPWPGMAECIVPSGVPARVDGDALAFRTRLLALLRQQRFVDGWGVPDGAEAMTGAPELSAAAQ